MSADIATQLTAILSADLAHQCGIRISRSARSRAKDLVSYHLRPHVPSGLWQWVLQPRDREGAHAYARRSVRYLIARATESGVACEIRHRDVERVAMTAGHTGGRGSRRVNAIEISAQAAAAEEPSA